MKPKPTVLKRLTDRKGRSLGAAQMYEQPPAPAASAAMTAAADPEQAEIDDAKRHFDAEPGPDAPTTVVEGYWQEERQQAAKDQCRNLPGSKERYDRAQSMMKELDRSRKAAEKNGRPTSMIVASHHPRGHKIEDLGHTPNAMEGAIRDAARSNGNGAATNGHRSKGAKENPVVTDHGGGSSTTHEKPTLSIALSMIDPTPDNARRTFDSEKLKSLSESMKAKGQKVPCQVRPAAKGRYVLTDGERRFRAAKLAKLATLRCVVDDITDEEAREDGLIINLQREDLNPIERAIGFKQLLDDGHTQEAVGKLVGVTQAEVSNTVRLLELPKELKDKLVEGKLSASHAIPLVPHARRPEWVKAFLHEAAQEKWALGPVSEVGDAIGSAYYRTKGAFEVHDVEDRKLAEKHAEAVDLVKLKDGPHDARHFILNKPAWEKLKGEKAKAKMKRRDTAEAQKAKAERAKAESEREARKFQDDLQDHLTKWYCLRIAAHARAYAGTDDGDLFCVKCLLLITEHSEPNWISGEPVLKAIGAAAGKPLKQGSRRGGQLVAFEWADLGKADVGKVLAQYVAAHFEELGEDGTSYLDVVEPEALRAITAGVAKLETHWAPTKEFLEAHSLEQLRELAIEWNLLRPKKVKGKKPAEHEADEDWTRGLKHSELVAELLSQATHRRLPPPEYLLKLAKGK